MVTRGSPDSPATFDQATPAAHFLFASDVAARFCGFAQIRDQAEIQRHINVALVVGSHLATRGHRGDWTRIHIGELARQVSQVEPDRDAFFMTVGRLLAWLHVDGWLDLRTLQRYVDRLLRIVDPQMPRTAAFLETMIERAFVGSLLANRRALLRYRRNRQSRRSPVNEEKSISADGRTSAPMTRSSCDNVYSVSSAVLDASVSEPTTRR